MKVVYNKNHVKHFQTMPWWYKSNALANHLVQDPSELSTCVERYYEEEEDDSFCIEEIDTIMEKSTMEKSNAEPALAELADELDATFRELEKSSKAQGEKLKRALQL